MLQFGIFISARIMHCGAQAKKDFVISFHNFHNSVRLQFVRDDQNETKLVRRIQKQRINELYGACDLTVFLSPDVREFCSAERVFPVLGKNW